MRKNTLVVQGKEYPCRVTMGAMVEFKRNTGVDITLGTTNIDMELIMWLIYCCLRSACRADSVEHPFAQMLDLADKLNPEDVVEWQKNNLPEATAASAPVKKK